MNGPDAAPHAASRVGPEALSLLSRVLGLDEPAVCDLVGAMEPVALRRGQVLFRQGDDGRSVFLVAEGRVKLLRESTRGRTSMLAVFGAGDVFGEMSVLSGAPRSGTVVALERSVVLELDQQALDARLEDQPALSGALMRHLARRLRASNEVVSDLVFADVAARVGRVLLRLADRFGEPGTDGRVVVEHRLTQDEVAQLVGAARETVNKSLSSLVARGLIELGPRKVTIVDLDRLRSLTR